MSGKLAKALDWLRHEPPLQGGGEARPGRLWTGLKSNALLDGRTQDFQPRSNTAMAGDMDLR